MCHSKSDKVRISVNIFLMISAILLCLLSPVMANASVVAERFTTKTKTSTMTLELSDIQGQDDLILDWRRPSAELNFDLPAGEFVESVGLNISASPQSGVSTSTPLMITINNGKPIPIHTEGYRFDAKIDLPTRRLRARNNILRIDYKTPSGQDCLLESHGSWTLDLGRSNLIMTSRARSRDLFIGEFDRRLANPATMPERVSISAKGNSALKLEALAAQGIGLRTPSIPKFQTRTKGADLRVLIGTRGELSSQLKGSKILTESGPRIALKEGKALVLVITGDTPGDVIEATKIFSTHALPDARRISVSAGEMFLQRALFPHHLPAGEEVALTDLGDTVFGFYYRPEPLTFEFSAEDTRHGEGEVVLQFVRNKAISESSRVTVTLNDKALGYAYLDKRKKSVAFTIPAGSLSADRNVLTVTPTLNASNSGCAGYLSQPGLALGKKSYIRLGEGGQSASLSGFAASGSLFAQNNGASTTVVLPARNDADYGPALRVIAKTAHNTGRGWTEASYTDESAAIIKNRNYIFLAPRRLPSELDAQMPEAMSRAWKNDPLVAAIEQDAPYVQIASNDVSAATSAMRVSGAYKTRQGLFGMAAVMPTGKGGSALVIGAQPGYRWDEAVSVLTEKGQWGALAGQVSRWDSATLYEAQAGGVKASQPISESTPNRLEKSTPTWKLALNKGQENWSNLIGSSGAMLSRLTTRPSPVTPQPVIAPAQPRLETPRLMQVEAAPTTELRAFRSQVSFDVPMVRPAVSETAPIALRRKTPEHRKTLGQHVFGPDWEWDNVTANVRVKSTSWRNDFVGAVSGPEKMESAAKLFERAVMSKAFWLITATLALIILVGGAKPKRL